MHHLTANDYPSLILGRHNFCVKASQGAEFYLLTYGGLYEAYGHTAARMFKLPGVSDLVQRKDERGDILDPVWSIRASQHNAQNLIKLLIPHGSVALLEASMDNVDKVGVPRGNIFVCIWKFERQGEAPKVVRNSLLD